MKKAFCLLGMFFCIQWVPAQKLIKKSIVNAEISHIKIDVNKCFELDLATSDNEELLVTAQIDGEYENDILINITEKGSTLLVSADFQPNFVNPNDKLSAHKVISIALKVRLPEQKDVQVFGTNCNVTAIGTYEFLKVSLNEGRCDLIDISERVKVTTQSGTISAKYSQAVVNAESKYGKVIGAGSENGSNSYDLNTVTGDILLKRIE